MTINQLNYFIAAAETRSFTKAAEQFYLSQTAITQQIRALEQQIGADLFDRSHRPVALTSAGHVFLHEAKKIISRMEGAVRSAQNAASGLTGTLKIGYTTGYEKCGLPGFLRSFRQANPNVFISCQRCPTDLLASGLLSNRFDLIYTWDSTNLQQTPQIRCCNIEKIPLTVVMYPSHPLAERSVLRRSDLKGEDILYMSPSETINSYGDAHYLELYEKAGVQPNILFRSTDMESILMMVAAEQGISVFPDYFDGKTRPVNTDNIVFIPLEGEDEYEQIDALWKEDNPNPALTQYLQLHRQP